MLRRTVLSYTLKINSQGFNFVPIRWNRKYKELALEKLSNRNKALTQFDDFYSGVYQDQWPSIRVALLSEEKKGVVVNNFSDRERVERDLQSIGAYNIRKVFHNQLKTLKENGPEELKSSSANIYQLEGRIEEALLKRRKNEIARIYPEPVDSNALEDISQNISVGREKQADDNSAENSPFQDPSVDTPLAVSLKSADYDTNRLILPGPTGMALSASLYDYVPTTRLKGMDDFIPESTHYRYYTDTEEVPYDLKVEEVQPFPIHLDVYAFERGNCDTFSYSNRGSTEMFDYHILRLCYLAPVLALGLKKGECVLDLLGSTLDVPMLISQSLTPGLSVINCSTSSRARYVMKYLDSFIYDSGVEESSFVVTNDHPLGIKDEGVYDKIIITAPSTCDRRAVIENENNMFSPALIKERLKLPETQIAILSKALELVKQGGAVVYCTETLSPIQNDAVVQKALEAQWTNRNAKFTIMDLSRAMEPLKPFLKILPNGKFGQLVTPFLPNNSGPLYFSKIVKNVE